MQLKAAVTSGHESDFCFFPRKILPGRRKRTDYTLYAANETTIPTYGWTSRTLNLGLRRDFTWRFMIADVQLPITDEDLISHYGLLVDCRNNRLLDGVTSLSTPGLIVPPCPQRKGHRRRHAPRQSPGGITGADKTNWEPSRSTSQHNTTHHIRTTHGPPVARAPRRLAPDRLAVVKAEFYLMLRDSTARRAEGPWSSALHLVPKKDSGWSPCGHYRTLNARTIPYR